MQQLWAPPLGLLENPLLATPPPKGFGAYHEELLETPEKAAGALAWPDVPFSAPNFIAGRARLLCFRNQMGRRPIPKDLKVRASFPESSSSLDSVHGEKDEETTGNAVAGAMLLNLIRGETAPITQEGHEQGAALLSLFKSQNGHRSKKEYVPDPRAAPPTNGGGRREQRPLPGANGTTTASNVRGAAKTGVAPAVAPAAAPTRAEIRKAAAAARELEKSSKLEDGSSEKVKASGAGPAAEAGTPKGQSAGRSRNAKRAPPTDPTPIQVQ
jgi:hypothetical protein